MRLSIVLPIVALALATPAIGHAGKCPKGTKPEKTKHTNGQLKTLGCLSKDGTRQGPWEEYYPEGNLRMKGDYDNGMRKGMWDEFYRTGKQQASCNYVRDAIDGDCKTWWDNGNVKEEGSWTEGQKNGPWKSWFEDGQQFEIGEYGTDFTGQGGNFKKGDWLIYHSNGKKALEAHYELDEPDGLYREWHPNGMPKIEVMMKAGKMSGSGVTFHENGKKAMIGTYEVGKLAGTATMYAPTGHKVEEALFKDDQRHGLSKVFDQSGKQVATQCFQYGERHWVSDSRRLPKCPTKKRLQLPPAMVEGRDFSDGLAAVKMGQKWGYIDSNGYVAVGPKFAAVGNFVRGVARATLDGKDWYAIDERGGRVNKPMPPASAAGSTGGITKAARDGGIDYLKNGRSLWADAKTATRKEGSARFPVSRDGKWGYIDATGKVVIPLEYEAAGAFSEGLGAVAVRGRIGYIDTSGAFVIQPRFTRARPFACGMAVVEVDGRTTYIDDLGLELTSNALEETSDCTEGLARVKVGESWGFLHPSGRMLIAARFDEVGPFSQGLARARKDAAYIDRTGRQVHTRVIPATDFGDGSAVVLGRHEGKQKYGVLQSNGAFTPFSFGVSPTDDPEFGPFKGGIARVDLKKKKKTGYADLKGELVHPLELAAGRDLADGLVAIQTDKGWGFIGADGKSIIEPQFSAVGDFSEGLARASGADGKWGFIDKTGKWVVEATYDEVRDFDRGLARVSTGDGPPGYVDKTGKLVWDPAKKAE